MDFFNVSCVLKKGVMLIRPNFQIRDMSDFMVRGGGFYGVWDEEHEIWSRDELDVAHIVDKELLRYQAQFPDGSYPTTCVLMSNFDSQSWSDYKRYLKLLPDNYHQFDDRVTFLNDKVKKTDYVSKRLPYALEPGDYSAFDELVGVLYDPPERQKIEWAIGAVIAGDAKSIQKFLVFYGEAGSGKSTVLNIIQQLFEGYCVAFNAKALGSTSATFATEIFRSNPLVAIQHDGDLSRIEDNSRLNSIISHERMEIQEKYRSSYTSKINAFLFMGTNRPVQITEAKSGILRRLIDVRPSGRRVPISQYQTLVNRIGFELGAIAYHCLEVYKSLGKHYYDGYRPFDMILKTNAFFNFVEANYFLFKEQDETTLTQAYGLYKEYCDDSGPGSYRMPRYLFREELKNYFREFKALSRNRDGKQIRSRFVGFLTEKFDPEDVEEKENEVEIPPCLVLDSDRDVFKEMYPEIQAQYASSEGTPIKKWDEVVMTLSEIDTSQLHYVRPPECHIVIDFDLKGEDGKKSVQKNLEAAAKWPSTYAEFSKSGFGVHLHYIYVGDVTKLSRVYDDSIEIKLFTGKSSLRRKFTKSNGLPIAKLNSGLPLKEEKPMLDFQAVQSEKGLRTMIKKNLAKEYHANTKPSIDFIYKILEDAYNSGLKYDVSDMHQAIYSFAAQSTNSSRYCLNLVSKMKFTSAEGTESVQPDGKDDRIVFFDCEVFPNLFLVNWKYQGKDQKCVRMINPSPQDIELLCKAKLVGFNNRRYDNHMLYARMMGYTNEQLYNLSQRIINGNGRSGLIREAYNLSYTDIYDFCATKQSLKKWEIELGLHHQELGLPWDQPVPEDRWVEVAEYCDNDVIATEATFEANYADFLAREILADLSGLTVNDTTNMHTTAIIFGRDRSPQSKFRYRDLSKPVFYLPPEDVEYLQKYTPLPLKFKPPYKDPNGNDYPESLLPYFPGYRFDSGKSTYRGEEVGEGGYVYAEPGMYGDVDLDDVASMHPSSAEDEVLFGPQYTERFSMLKLSRIAIKHNDLDLAAKMFDGKLSKYLGDPDKMNSLSYALKIAINSVYGLTSAKFENQCRDPRNVDNIVAKRGALFMIDLKHAVQERGFTVAHIKTDSIKIPDATPEIIQFVMDFGKQYGYIFEHEATYDRMCLVNNAVYIAKYATIEHCEKIYGSEYVHSGKSVLADCKKHGGEWAATGAQFAQPYVFKTLFSKEQIEFQDLCETKSVSTALYLDMNENLPENEHAYVFVGKTGRFCPMKPGCGGGVLLREKDGKYNAATGSTGYRWIESEVLLSNGETESIDRSYYRKMVDEAVANISQYGDFEWFVSDEPYCGELRKKDSPPWAPECERDCSKCSHFHDDAFHLDCDLGYEVVPF